MDNIRREAAARDVPFETYQFHVLFLNVLLKRCVEWENKDAAMRHRTEQTTVAGLYRVLAVLFFSQTTRLSTDKALDVLSDMDMNVPSFLACRSTH